MRDAGMRTELGFSDCGDFFEILININETKLIFGIYLGNFVAFLILKWQDFILFSLSFTKHSVTA